APLGRTCAFDSDCGTIIPARCSADNKCICAMSYTNIENTKCELLLGAECSEEIPCVAENSVCVNHNCECKANFKTNLTNGICEPTLLGKYCNLAYECEDVFHMKCYENKCVCRANNVVVNFQCRS
ncbi:GSCOCG00004512001-RA-CDS, partial [Cotesia congregata]